MRKKPSDRTWCPGCEVEVASCDQDGCCLACGEDLFHDEDGNPRDTAWGRWIAAEQRRYAEESSR